MSRTCDGQPAADLRAVVDAMLAAAWCEGRDAAAALCLAKNEGRRHMSYDSRAHDPDDLACEIADLMPPPDLAAALAEHTRRAVEAERKAITLIAQKHIAVGNDLLDWELGGNERLQWVLNAIAARGTP